MKLRNTILLIAFLAPLAGIGQHCKGIQYECADIKKGEPKAPKGTPAWTLTGQSRYGNFAYGDTTEVNITVYKGVNYRLSFCAIDPQLVGKILFQIVERKTKAQTEEYFVTESVPKVDADGNIVMDADQNPVMETRTIKKTRRVYAKVPHVRYDNATDSNKQWVEFTTDSDRALTIKVIIPNIGEKPKNELSPAGFACLGLLVEQQAGPQANGWK